MKTKYINAGERRVQITSDRDGRLSIVVRGPPTSQYPLGKTMVDVEFPAGRGEAAHAFKPTVKLREEIEIEILNE